MSNDENTAMYWVVELNTTINHGNNTTKKIGVATKFLSYNIQYSLVNRAKCKHVFATYHFHQMLSAQKGKTTKNFMKGYYIKTDKIYYQYTSEIIIHKIHVFFLQIVINHHVVSNNSRTK